MMFGRCKLLSIVPRVCSGTYIRGIQSRCSAAQGIQLDQSSIGPLCLETTYEPGDNAYEYGRIAMPFTTRNKGIGCGQILSIMNELTSIIHSSGAYPMMMTTNPRENTASLLGKQKYLGPSRSSPSESSHFFQDRSLNS